MDNWWPVPAWLIKEKKYKNWGVGGHPNKHSVYVSQQNTASKWWEPSLHKEPPGFPFSGRVITGKVNSLCALQTWPINLILNLAQKTQKNATPRWGDPRRPSNWTWGQPTPISCQHFISLLKTFLQATSMFVFIPTIIRVSSNVEAFGGYGVHVSAFLRACECAFKPWLVSEAACASHLAMQSISLAGRSCKARQAESRLFQVTKVIT